MMDRKFTIVVPDGHPMRGACLVLYPDNGATTYIDSEITIVSLSIHQLQNELAALRATINAARRRGRNGGKQ